MADPTIQTFCCHHANGTDVAVMIMQEFNTDAYNIVCLLSATLGIFGALYQILPREQFSHHHQWLSFSAIRGRKIIVWLAVADLLASLGVFTRSTIWINYKNIMPATDDNSSVLFCALSSAFTQYFYTSTWIWTLCYAIDMRMILTQKESHMKFYHLAAWVIPAISTATGLCLLYFPDANCHTHSSLKTTLLRILPNYILTYIPIAITMVANPCLYMHSTKDMERIITSTSGQFTSKERNMIDSIKLKFSAINIVFYICWTPNLLNGLLLWILWFHLPVTSIITLWYIMALMNPLQALLNCLVYRRWSYGSERVILPWRQLETTGSTDSKRSLSKSSLEGTVREEIYPLLQNAPSNSALMNPLQALLNCLVYRRWSYGSERVILPWRQLETTGSTDSKRSLSKSSLEGTVREEIYPLLQNAPSNSALMNPLQALLNCLVYRRWSYGSERVILPWRQLETTGSTDSKRSLSKSSLEGTVREEIYPLLQNAPSNSVNLYQSLTYR